MKRLFILILAILPIGLFAQTMWYQGGKGDGTGQVVLSSFGPQLISNYYPYLGGKADGHGLQATSSFQPGLLANQTPYTGGIADGHSLAVNNNFQPTIITNHFPYLGGIADGYSQNGSNSFQPNLINNFYPYIGGKGDGWSNALNQSFVLPLVLLSFEGSAMEDYNALSWKTSYEENVDYFLVEKSKNGVDFASIGTVNAVGNSSEEQDYGYNDREDVQGVNYYKLRMTDIDETYKYSKIIKLINEKLDYSVVLAPNPAQEKISIRLSRALETSSEFVVLDISGKVMLRSKISRDEAVKNIDIRSLAKGQYMIYLKLANDTMSLPFIKQ